VITRRHFNGLALGGTAAWLAGAGPAAAAKGYEPIRKGGHYSQPWFLDSFLELKDDLDGARERGKRFAVTWELEGCPYCREMHRVNFAIPEVRDFVRDNFAVLQLDIWGARAVTDFDGKSLEERALARRSRITFTPTFQFFPEAAPAAGGPDAEVTRMAGYFRPFHFLTMFEFVRDKAYENADFQRYLLAKVEDMKKRGVEIKMW